MALRRKSSWSTGPGFINILGSGSLKKLTAVTDAAPRGSNLLGVASTSGLYPGSWVVVAVSDVGGNLMRDMTGGLAAGCRDKICVNAQNVFRMATRLASVGPGNQVVLERALPFNVSTAFRPALYEFAPALRDLGVVGVTLDFQSGKYKGRWGVPCQLVRGPFRVFPSLQVAAAVRHHRCFPRLAWRP